jgi:hypothetical protein
MMGRTTCRTAIAALSVAVGSAATPAKAQDAPNYRMGEINVGDPVIFDGKSCTVTAVKPDYIDKSVMDNMTVRCANGSTYQPMANVSMVRKGGGGAAPARASAGGGGYAAMGYGDPALRNLRPAASAIPSGVYLCKAGNTRNMLTLGQMRVAGNRFTFIDPRGYRTAGSYSMGPRGYAWQGDIGRIANSQILGSGLEPGGRAFWFMFKEAPGSLAQSVSCGRIG